MQNGKIGMPHHLEEYVVKNPLTQHFSFYAPFSVQVRIKKKRSIRIYLTVRTLSLSQNLV